MERKQAALLQQPDPLKPARHFVPNLPVALDVALIRALAVEPEQRLQSVVEFKRQLEAVQVEEEKTLELATVPISPPPPKAPPKPKPEVAVEAPHQTTPALRATPPYPRRGKSRYLTWIAIVAIMVIGLVAGGGRWIGKTSPAPSKPADPLVAPVVVTPPVATPSPVALPKQRFTDNSDGTVTDKQSGLIWLKDANCFGYKDWSTAMDLAKRLKNGQCGLRDRSVAGQWRLPSKEEWKALIDTNARNPALPSGHPFTGVQSNVYWSSAAYGTSDTGGAWGMFLGDGGVYTADKTYTGFVWPVRDGR
jgi:hypothetical protein